MLNKFVFRITRLMAMTAACLVTHAMAAPPAQFAPAFALFEAARHQLGALKS